jgi:hypothetical protein
MCSSVLTGQSRRRISAGSSFSSPLCYHNTALARNRLQGLHRNEHTLQNGRRTRRRQGAGYEALQVRDRYARTMVFPAFRVRKLQHGLIAEANLKMQLVRTIRRRTRPLFEKTDDVLIMTLMNGSVRRRCSLPQCEPDQALLAELRRLPQVHPCQGRGLCTLPPGIGDISYQMV